MAKISQILWKIEFSVIIVTLLKTKDKEQILRAARENWHFTNKRIIIQLIAHFSENMTPEKSEALYMKVLKENLSTLNSISNENIFQN